ncbi:bifunctional metallophosphatase/5'-nucleotidase [Cohnella candidum]|uniref:bifunctional metallophosphatase/5'-nucleotidase n=1 Tax=Cohnella candidum TaxID=2674991 RepID=UPI0013DD99A2|nr:bifunctional UDP-sugar hydrolase/5'-nucleotidase [Cohnella candidum]
MTEPKARVTLLHTNDIHSHLEQAAQIAGYVKSIRAKVPADELLLVDCGDFLDRSRPETEGTSGAVNRSLLQAIGYDALLPGNNEGLTYTFEQMNSFYDGLSIPVVCANFRPLRPEDEIGWLKPSLVVRKSGINIGLIGLTAPFNVYYELLGWQASDPVEAAAREVERIRNQADLLIVMSHLGLRQDERLAALVPGIDLILGAHTHHLLEKPLYVGDTAMSAAGKFGSHIGHLRMTLAPESRKWKVEGGCLSTEGWPADEEAEAIIDAGRREAKRRMSRVVAVLEEPLDWAPFRESPLSDFLASVVRRKTGAEIGLVNAGQFLDGLPAGEVTEETVHALCPSPINCCRLKLKGKELLQVMEESLLPEFHELEIRGFGFRGHVLGTLCYDGLEADADLSRRPYERISNVRVDGKPLEPDRDYTIGTLDMFTFGVGHLGLKEGRDVEYLLPEFIRECLIDELGDRQLVRSAAGPRIRLTGRNPSQRL